MELTLLETALYMLAFCCSFFIVATFAIFLPEIIRFVRLLSIRRKYKKLHTKIEKVLVSSPPPRASFFSRTNGKYLMIEGPYEDKYLSSWKRRIWKRSKKNRLQPADKKNKTD